MYEDYTRQALPSQNYRALLGSAICVFNSNNSFVIENILRIDQTGQYKWGELIDKMSGQLKNDIRNTITNNSNDNIANLFNDIVYIRNRIVHSFQFTAPPGITDDPHNQMLATKCIFLSKWTPSGTYNWTFILLLFGQTKANYSLMNNWLKILALTS